MCLTKMVYIMNYLVRVLFMKKTTLILTFLIYTFSVFAEAGIISSFLSEKSFDNHSSQSASISTKQVNNSVTNTNGDSEDSGHCEESICHICHIGHCHHVSTAAFAAPSSPVNLSNIFSRKPNLVIAHDYSNKLKRPPRLS